MAQRVTRRSGSASWLMPAGAAAGIVAPAPAHAAGPAGFRGASTLAMDPTAHWRGVSEADATNPSTRARVRWQEAQPIAVGTLGAQHPIRA